MSEVLSLRSVSSGDEAFLYRVYASTREEELAVLDWTEAQKEAFLRMQFNAQHSWYQAEYPNAAFQIILAGSTPIGRLYVDRRQDEIRIIDIALLPEHRRAGIGSSLLRALLAEADAANKPVRIHVEAFNPALLLYERLGFVRIGNTGVYYLMERPPGSSRS